MINLLHQSYDRDETSFDSNSLVSGAKVTAPEGEISRNAGSYVRSAEARPPIYSACHSHQSAAVCEPVLGVFHCALQHEI